MKSLKKAVCLLLCCGLLLTALAACAGKEEPEPSSAAPTVAPTPTPEPTPEASPTPMPTPFVPAPDLIPDVDGENMDEFETAFSLNPIDKAYDEDYARASSFSMMRRACDDAARRWKEMVNVAYESALACLTDDGEQLSLRQSQSEWLETVDGRIYIIRDEAGEDNEGVLSAARQIVLLYRERAMELCRIRYENAGDLPTFPDAESAAAG